MWCTPNSRNKLYPPNLLPVTDEYTSQVLEVLKYRMFDIGYKAGPMDGELQSTCLASILMHIRQMVDEFTEEHRTVKSILRAASRLTLDQKPLTLDNLLLWGDLIKEHWTTRKATAVTASFEQLSSKVATPEGRLIVTQEQVKSLAKEVASTNESLRLMSGMMKEVVRFVEAQELKTFIAPPTTPSNQASPETHLNVLDMNCFNPLILAPSDRSTPTVSHVSIWSSNLVIHRLKSPDTCFIFDIYSFSCSCLS